MLYLEEFEMSLVSKVLLALTLFVVVAAPAVSFANDDSGCVCGEGNDTTDRTNM